MDIGPKYLVESRSAQARMREIVSRRLEMTWDSRLPGITMDQMVEIILEVIGIVDTNEWTQVREIYAMLAKKGIYILVDLPRQVGNWPGLDNIPEIERLTGGPFDERIYYRARRINGIDVIRVVGTNPGLNTLEICVLLNMRRYRSDVAVNDILPNRNITEKTATWPGLGGIPEIYMDYWGRFYLWNAVPPPAHEASPVSRGSSSVIQHTPLKRGTSTIQ